MGQGVHMMREALKKHGHSAGLSKKSTKKKYRDENLKILRDIRRELERKSSLLQMLGPECTRDDLGRIGNYEFTFIQQDRPLANYSVWKLTYISDTMNIRKWPVLTEWYEDCREQDLISAIHRENSDVRWLLEELERHLNSKDKGCDLDD